MNEWILPFGWIPWAEEPGRLQSIGSQRAGHNWSSLAHMRLPFGWPALGSKIEQSGICCTWRIGQCLQVYQTGEMTYDFRGGQPVISLDLLLFKVTTQRDGMGREEGWGFRMGNTCIPVVDSFLYLAKLIQLCKV